MLDSFKEVLTQTAKRLIYTTVKPVGPACFLYRGIFKATSIGQNAFDFARRALVATPAFLSICETYGDCISVDRIPYVPVGPLRIRLGSNIRISGQIEIFAAHARNPLLEIGDGTFIGHGASIGLASHIKIGNYVAIGGGTYITDTEGHEKQPGELKPAWECPALESSIAPVVIEDGCWIGRNAAIFRGVRIGAGSVIGYGAMVRANVPPGSMVVGNPARNIPTKLYRPEASAAGTKAPSDGAEARG